MKEEDDEEKRKKEKKKKIMSFKVATNVFANQPPKHLPTGTPIACANSKIKNTELQKPTTIVNPL